MTLREFVEAADKRIVERFDATSRILPMYHIIDGAGRDVILPAPPIDKDTAVKLIRVYMHNLKATRYLYVDEAWALFGADANERAYDTYASLKDHPKRCEVITYLAEDQNEAMIAASREIIRKTNARPRLGPLTFPSDREGSVGEGRMVGLLPQRGTMQ